MKIKLIDDVRGSLRLLSIHVAAAWATIIGVLIADPSLAIRAWQALPDEIRAVLPPWVRGLLGALTIVSSIWAARVIKQPVRNPEAKP